MNGRQQQILNILEQKGEIRLQELTELAPNVSSMTLRRDLISLENEGYLIRTIGGAVSAKKVGALNGEEDAYSRRASEHIEAKFTIAEKALPLVETGRSIYFDAGSTVMCLAKLLPDENYSIMTCSANIALELVKKLSPAVMVLGGLLNRNTLSLSGPGALDFLDTVNIDIAFMSSSGFSIEHGFTVSNMYECELKKKVVNRAKKIILMIDSSKIGKTLPFTFARLENIHTLIVEDPNANNIASECRSRGIEIL
ncbi:MAG TPA: DeoR/GlpR family DNA-binding transcription regulator [Anaerovoracaceae bacterium]|nr:DeoR/GlpR family DNA-binding transcription regulator [Anaerovoracaceae bacterium]